MRQHTIATTWRARLQQQQANLRAAFERRAGTATLLRQHSRLMDRLLRDLWRETRMPPELALIAVGGYGRGELFPHSDVDLLILLPDIRDPAHDVLMEQLVGLLWDMGIAVGHSVRTLEECRREAAADITVATSLLEARWLAGNRATCQHLMAQMKDDLIPAEFFLAKQREQQQRHTRFNDSAYNLEPNVKESPGGLRDLHHPLWISQSLGLGHDWETLAGHGFISIAEARHIRRHELFLQTLRVRLHYLAGRREDRLLFDFQNELAAQLGLTSSPRRRASEELMRRYYRSAKAVALANEILLSLLEERALPAPAALRKINARFQARGERLELRAPGLLQQQPAAILESFVLLGQIPELHGMSAALIRELVRAAPLVNTAFRASPQNRQNFMAILRQRNGVTATLRRMNRYGILGRYIPSFSRISGQMQHDLFHIYTVDEHTLNVLRNLRHFAQPEHDHEFPLCSRLMQPFEQPELLYLSALFHDIAKGRGGDHSTLGTVDALRFCKAHALPAADTQLVAWLVKNHLLMSGTAQKQDLSDPALLEQFAARMGDERHLTALYLLTVADIRGTNPAIWNAWKAKLLENLFHATRRLLRGERGNAGQEITARQQQAATTLRHYAILPPSYEALWAAFGPSYFLRHESQEIAWHTRLLLRHARATTPIVRARLSPGGDGVQVMIYLPDRDDLFARICSFFERTGYNIVEARIYTTQHGYALDSFLVLDEGNRAAHYRNLMSYIEYELTQQISHTAMPPPAPLQGRISRQLKHFPLPTEITFTAEPDSSQHQLFITAGDRPGLLSCIAHQLLLFGIRLHTAKINTLGNRAEDTFFISARDGSPLPPATVLELRQALLANIQASVP